MQTQKTKIRLSISAALLPMVLALPLIASATQAAKIPPVEVKTLNKGLAKQVLKFDTANGRLFKNMISQSLFREMLINAALPL